MERVSTFALVQNEENPREYIDYSNRSRRRSGWQSLLAIKNSNSSGKIVGGGSAANDTLSNFAARGGGGGVGDAKWRIDFQREFLAEYRIARAEAGYCRCGRFDFEAFGDCDMQRATSALLSGSIVLGGEYY